METERGTEHSMATMFQTKLYNQTLKKIDKPVKPVRFGSVFRFSVLMCPPLGVSVRFTSKVALKA